MTYVMISSTLPPPRSVSYMVAPCMTNGTVGGYALGDDKRRHI